MLEKCSNTYVNSTHINDSQSSNFPYMHLRIPKILERIKKTGNKSTTIASFKLITARVRGRRYNDTNRPVT